MSNTLSTYIDSVFDEFMNIRPTATRYLTATPPLNIQELDDRFVVTLVIAGLDPKDVKISLVDKNLSINYEHTENKDQNEGKLIRQEYAHYSFARSISLPKNVDDSSVTAKSSKGILTIDIKKMPESQPKTIDIDIEN
jgi:HSP20 family protein